MNKQKKPLSLYVHIPFCVRKCLYCDFLSGPAEEGEKEEYVNLLSQEIASWGRQLEGEYRLETIFLGGGTPSCLTSKQLEKLGNIIQNAFSTGENLEFTTEANPGTVSAEHIRSWKDMGINRISLGLQSAQEEELRRLGRIHTYLQFLETYESLRDAGFDNINIDLMADIPGQTMESYRDTLEKVIALIPQHISAYSLIVEPGTPFYEMEQKGILEREGEDIDRKMYDFTREYLQEHGYHRYEISNYALAGRECRHNCVYWQGGEYLGVGLGASSYLHQHRFSNQTRIGEYKKYVQKLEQSERWTEWEFAELSPVNRQMQMEEFMFLGLRMQQGISKKEFKRRFGVDIDIVYGDVFKRLFQDNLLAGDGFHDRIYLTNRGIDLSNMVLAEFLLEE
ncbi:MAG: oxygen-independent coproporphyrinogen III oxidase [Lachnospiraceae bacterium]|nr:oxygen-independent coproporphyrinogen III oxidase [Lachnospiraceae bacterium]